MTPADDFRAWLDRMGWGVREAARQMRHSPSQVSRWASGERKVPPYVARMCELFDELKKETRP